jgi:beta-N-acetylglucosaminidase
VKKLTEVKTQYEIVGEKKDCSSEFSRKGRNLLFKSCVGVAVTAFVMSSCTSHIEGTMKKSPLEQRAYEKATQELATYAEKQLNKVDDREKGDRGETKEAPKEPQQETLLTQSWITAEQLNSFLASNPKSNLKYLGNTFKAVEAEIGVNAIYLAAIAIHESGWGTNQVTKQKNNVMSICAYDWNPLGAATTYATKGQCIYAGALLLRKDYLNPKGKYFHGATLEGINVKYATDKGWAKKVRAIAKSIEGSV